jgi:hypothetical protein
MVTSKARLAALEQARREGELQILEAMEQGEFDYLKLVELKRKNLLLTAEIDRLRDETESS